MFIPQVRRQGSVQLDAREDSKGKMQTRFLIVEVINIHFRLWAAFQVFSQIGYDTVVVVDNRHCWAGPAPKRLNLILNLILLIASSFREGLEAAPVPERLNLVLNPPLSIPYLLET